MRQPAEHEGLLHHTSNGVVRLSTEENGALAAQVGEALLRGGELACMKYFGRLALVWKSKTLSAQGVTPLSSPWNTVPLQNEALSVGSSR